MGRMLRKFRKGGYIVESASRSKGSSRSWSPRPRYDDERRSRSRSYESVSPARRTPNPRRSPSPCRTPPTRGGSPDGRNHEECSPTLKSVSLCGRPADSQSPSRHSNADE